MATFEGKISIARREIMGRYDWLSLSAKYWFVVTVLGQWLFIFYIMGYYGVRFAEGGVAGFEGTHLANGFIAGDSTGNIALVIHVLVSGLIIAAGQIQLMPNIRKKAPRLHRFSGWFYMLSSVMVSIAGTYLVWSRERAIGSLVQDIGVTGSGVLIMLFVPIALYYAIKRDIAKHRQWALRLFMVVSAVWFLRIFIFAWLMVTGGVGIDMATFSGPFLSFVHFAQYLVPLAILELYFWAQRSSIKSHRLIVAGLLVLATVVMTLGIVGVALYFWLPYIGA